MERYQTIEDVIPKLKAPTKVDYSDVLDFYKYTSGEYNKWITKYNQEIAHAHFQGCENDFSKMEWSTGQMKGSDLYPLTLCIGTQWIIKLACENSKCPKYNSILCEECLDPLESTTPTLYKLINSVKKLNTLDTIYANSRLQTKIKSIQESIANKSCRLAIIIYDNQPPYVFDGNNRLISLALMGEMENHSIDCYIGRKC